MVSARNVPALFSSSPKQLKTHPNKERRNHKEEQRRRQMAEANSYEEQRRRQAEESKRKLDELRRHHPSAAVREAATKPPPKRKAQTPRAAGVDGPLRRSGRLASLPEQANYGDKKHPEHAKYRNGGLTNMVDLDAMLDNRYVTGVTSAILGKILVDTNNETNPVHVDGHETDDDLETMSAIKKAKTSVNANGDEIDDDLELTISGIKKAKTLVNVDVDELDDDELDDDLELKMSAIKKAKTLVNVAGDETDNDLELTMSAIKKAMTVKREAKSIKDDVLMKEDKNTFLREYKKAVNTIALSVESASSNKTPPTTTPSMKSVLMMVRECGVEEGTSLFYTATKLFVKAKYRELFPLIETKHGRFDWLQRAHDEGAKLF